MWVTIVAGVAVLVTPAVLANVLEYVHSPATMRRLLFSAPLFGPVAATRALLLARASTRHILRERGQPQLVHVLKMSSGQESVLDLQRMALAFEDWPQEELADRQGDRAVDRGGRIVHDLRAEPHPMPAQVTVEMDTASAPTFTIRLEPHGDAGTQALNEVA